MGGLISNLVNTVLNAPAWLVYLIVGAVVFGESAATAVLINSTGSQVSHKRRESMTNTCPNSSGKSR